MEGSRHTVKEEYSLRLLDVERVQHRDGVPQVVDKVLLVYDAVTLQEVDEVA